jgi:Mg-chelatase subunit ChlD
MGLTIDDIRGAIAASGDVSSFVEICHEALGDPPVPAVPLFDTPLELPLSTALLEQIDPGLAASFTNRERAAHIARSPSANVAVTLLPVAPYGKNIGTYLEKVIDELQPSVIAIDSCPVEFSADILYAFSLPGAVGLPAYGEIVHQGNGAYFNSRTFHAGGVHATAILKSWLHKIPLLPAGAEPQRKAAEHGLDDAGWQQNLSAAYGMLDERVSAGTDFQSGIRLADEISAALMKAAVINMNSHMREHIAVESYYVASRLADIASDLCSRGDNIRILAIIDIARYQDMKQVIGLLLRGITEEIYFPMKTGCRAADMVMMGKHHDTLQEKAQKHAPTSTLAQELFSRQFEAHMKAKSGEVLTEAETHRLITEIARRTRFHPAIARGVSVRGTIAFEEIVKAVGEMGGGLTRENIRKAALITLPTRIALKQQQDDASAIIGTIAKEVLYGIRFACRPQEAELAGMLQRLGAGDILDSLGELGQVLPEHGNKPKTVNAPAVVCDPEKYRKLLQCLENRQFLKKEDLGRFTLTEKALEYLLDQLEHKLRDGEISASEYDQQKSRLMSMMSRVKKPQFQMTAKELATTVMELMDAKDKQWSSEVSFERMHVYYHVKENSEGAELSPQKRDYNALKRLIDDMEKREILRAAEKTSGLLLTGTALDILLNYLIENDAEGRGQKETKGLGRVRAYERTQAIRRYSSGDTFRDLSVRHTLKEIARHKKPLPEIRKRDLRVYLKEPRQPQTDIIVCIDTSGSMGFRHKLIYARLAAAGLVRAAIEAGDNIGMVTFDDYGQVTVPLTATDRDSLLDRIAGLSARGNTNIGDGIACSGKLLFQNHSSNLKSIVLITDGQPTALSEPVFSHLKALKEKDLTEESALLETRQAAAKGARLSVIHIADRGEPSGKFIRDIARIGNGKIHRMSGPEDLRVILH